MSQLLRVLILEDLAADAYLMVVALRQAGYNPVWERVDTEADYAARLENSLDLILADYALPQFSAPRALQIVRERGFDIPFIIVSGSIGEETAVAAMKAGATDYLLKDRLGRLGPAVTHALEQRQAVLALRESHERTRQILATTYDPFIAMDAQGRISDWNARAEATFGWSRDEALGRDLAQTIIPPRYRAAHVARLRNFLDRGEGPMLNRHLELTAIQRDGTEFAIELIARPVRVGQSHSFGGFARDIRERKRAEEVLRERSRHILLTAEVGAALNRAVNLRDTLHHCAQSLVDHLDAVSARIWTCQEGADVLELQANAGADVPARAIMIDGFAQQRAVYVSNDLAGILRESDQAWVKSKGIVAFANHPLIIEDRFVGALTIFSGQPIVPTTLEVLANVANQLAAGIERRRAEERLKFTQFTIDHIATAVFWSDPEGHFFDVNEAACSLTGYSREELLSLHFSDLDLSITRESWQRMWQELQTRRSLTMESHVRHRNGAEIPIIASTNMLQGGGRECSCTFVQDTIERKAAEFAQRQSELRFRAIFDQTFEFVGLLSADGAILEFNHPALGFRGLTLADVAGQPLWETLWLDHSSETREQTRQAVAAAATGNFVRMELSVRDAAELSRTFDFSVKPVKNEAGQIELLIVEARDITDQKRLEEQLRQSQKMEAVGKLAGGVAHDFNNLLTIILGYSDMLQDRLQGDPLLELVDEIDKAGQRAAGLTRQLLAFSRKQVLAPVVLDLKVLLTEMEKMLARLIGEDVNLVFHRQAALWNVLVDPGQIEQVVMNLVVNARDAMPQGGTLTIEIANVEVDEAHVVKHSEARTGEHVLLSVSDTGCGMDRATLSQIFEPFFTTKGPEKGTGLGLATVYGIIKQSGGHIAVNSEIGCGTTFNIYLPRERAGLTVAAPPASAYSGQRGTETVLVVEDDDSVRLLIRVILQQQGYQVLEARHGEEAWQICNQSNEPIHLLAADVAMPNLSGRELAERLVLTRPDMKVLYLSGYLDDAVVRHGLEDSPHLFVQKPYTPEVLLQKVREILDQREVRL